MDSDTLEDDEVQVDVRGKRLKAVIAPYHMRVDAPPFARPKLLAADIIPLLGREADGEFRQGHGKDGNLLPLRVVAHVAKEILQALSGGKAITEPVKNALNTLQFEGHTVRVAKTGYTGEPLGYEVYIESAGAEWLWNRLIIFAS